MKYVEVFLAAKPTKRYPFRWERLCFKRPGGGFDTAKKTFASERHGFEYCFPLPILLAAEPCAG